VLNCLDLLVFVMHNAVMKILLIFQVESTEEEMNGVKGGRRCERRGGKRHRQHPEVRQEALRWVRIN
jgi:hypothetical protein